MARMTEEEQEALAAANMPDETLVSPPGSPVESPVLRPLTRDDGNISGLIERPVERVSWIQHEFSPLVRQVTDEEWRQLAKKDGGVNWRIIRQD